MGIEEAEAKKKKRKKGAKDAPVDVAKKAATNDAWAALSDWRSSRPQAIVAEAATNEELEREQQLKKDKDPKPAKKEDDLSTSIDDAFAALRKNIDDLEKKCT